jgi:hypothetical protein
MQGERVNGTTFQKALRNLLTNAVYIRRQNRNLTHRIFARLEDTNQQGVNHG